MLFLCFIPKLFRFLISFDTVFCSSRTTCIENKHCLNTIIYYIYYNYMHSIFFSDVRAQK